MAAPASTGGSHAPFDKQGHVPHNIVRYQSCRVWKHFTGEDPIDQSSDNTGRQGHIIQSDKPPLYFQHGNLHAVDHQLCC